MRANLLRYLCPVFFFASLPSFSLSQTVAKPLPLHAAVQDKDFYLLSLLQSDPQVRKILTTDIALKGISAERARSMALSVRSCKGDSACVLKAFLWTDEE